MAHQPIPRVDEDSPPLRRPTPAPLTTAVAYPHGGVGGGFSHAEDTAKAFDELEAWLRAHPSGRSVWTIDRMNGKWRVGLQCGEERLSASQDVELRGAIRNAIMIVRFAGYV